MKKLLTVLMLLSLMLQAEAQVSVNVDYKTVAAMTAAYAAGEISETYYYDQLKDILGEYAKAEVGAASIFASKFLDRKAMTDVGMWTGATENMYYRRIYNLVSAKIMPKIWTVGGLMLKSPGNAIYWGSYLTGVCSETKNLCMQFESVVTNSNLTFSGVNFLKVNDGAAQTVDITKAGGQNWKDKLSDVASRAKGSITRENLRNDLTTFKDKAAALVSEGASGMREDFLQESSFNSLFQGDVSAIVSIVDSYSELYSAMEEDAGAALLAYVGGEEAIGNLFDMDSYSMTSWISDYALSAVGTYYTQHWYIDRVDEGDETVCDYTPDQSKDNIINGSEWTRFGTNDPDFSPSGNQYDQIYDNSKRYTGVDVDYLLSQSGKNGNRYRISTSLYAYRITTNGNLTEKSYAYGIKITHTWNRTETVYDEVFDSYTMDLAWFQQHMNQMLSELKEEDPDHNYKLRQGDRRTYQATDEKKIQGVETAAITVTCSDGTKLASGQNDYKCYTCESSVNAHTRQCVMYTSKDEDAGNIMADLDEKISGLTERMDEIMAREVTIAARIIVLKVKILFASGENAILYEQEIEDLQEEYAAISEEYDQLEADRNTLTSQYDQIAAEEAEEDEYYRMPAIMADLKTSFDLEWQDDGHWEGNTFVRKATMPNVNGIITFRGLVTLARKAQYLLGIKIHRAIVRTTWELTADWVESTVYDILVFDESMTDAQKAQRVNEVMSEAARAYPDCDITVEYARSEPPEEDETDDTFHLLWSSDRLKVAREVEARLAHIYTELVSLEKMMSYRRSVSDVLRDMSSQLDMDMGRRRTVIEECQDNWIRNAKLPENGKGK